MAWLDRYTNWKPADNYNELCEQFKRLRKLYSQLNSSDTEERAITLEKLQTVENMIIDYQRSNQYSTVKLKDLKYQIPGKENKRMLVEAILCFLLLPICVVLFVLTRLTWMFIAYMNWQWSIICIGVIVAFVLGLKRIVQHLIKP